MDDFERSYRLEVSGTDEGSRDDVERRLTQKVKQARAGDSDLPAFAVVVGFREKLVMYTAIEGP